MLNILFKFFKIIIGIKLFFLVVYIVINTVTHFSARVVDSELAFYDDVFSELYYKLYKGNLSTIPAIPKVNMVFGTTSGNTLAYCESQTLFGIKHNRKIVVNYGEWINSSKTSRMAIMLHELAHCVLDRSHVFEPKENGICPSTLMIPTLMSDECFEANIGYYGAELFRYHREKGL